MMHSRLRYCLSILLFVCLSGAVFAQEPTCSNERPIVFAWDPIRLPKPTNLCDFVKDEEAAIKLGKAFFWDMQVGSDGIMACGTCHFHAGVDNRTKNQLSPKGAPESTTAGASFEVSSPNGTVTAQQFPFHKRQDYEDRFSTVLSDSNDVMSSQGVHRSSFVDIIPGQAEESVTVPTDPVFNVGGVNTRRVEPRNTMNVFNAVFNIEQFWDGRGKFYFNGVNTHGLLDENARILAKQGEAIDAPVAQVKVEIDMASLASQAVGPPMSTFEMSAEGRPFPKLGKKLLSLVPLGKQVVHPTDSALGPLSKDDGSLTIPGLQTTYKAMIEAAFHEKYWNSNKVFDINKNPVTTVTPGSTDQFNMMELNFTLFWGLAIQLYESTLISDDSPFDRFMAGDETAMTEEEQRGMELFFHEDIHCFRCHKTPEMSNATIDHLVEFPTGRIERVLERMTMAVGGPHEDNEVIYDGGFYNIGARPTSDDIGRGGSVSISTNGSTVEQPLSFTKYALANGEAANRIPSPPLDPPLQPDEIPVNNGAMRVPTLRNVELTGPYYHNGGLATLADVLLFYTRGGDFREENIEFFDPAIGLGSDEFLKGRPDNQRAIVKFISRPLTDDRVRYKRAPFDHPEIFVPNGHLGDGTTVTNDGTGRAQDDLMRVAPVGAAGIETPLSTFLDLPPEQPSQ